MHETLGWTLLIFIVGLATLHASLFFGVLLTVHLRDALERFRKGRASIVKAES
jgi:hypothetical protein